MGRFDRYLLSQLLTLFGFFSLVLILLYWVNRAVVLFDELVGDGQTLLVFLEFSALSLPGIIRIVMPLAAFVAALYVTNRLASESELVVVQASGFSPYRIARPVVVFGLIVTVLTGILTHILYPAASEELAARESEIARNITARLLTEGQFLTPTDGLTVYIRDITESGELQDIFLADSRDADSQVIYTASSAYLVRSERGPHLVMIDGLAQTLRTSDQRLYTTRFEDFTYDISRLMPADTTPRLRARYLPSWELWPPTQEVADATGDTIAELRVTFHDRISQSLMALTGAVLGMSALLVGSFSRFGVWKQVVVAILLIVFINAMETVATQVTESTPELWPVSYLPAASGLLIGFLLLTLSAHPEWLRRRPRAAQA
ncbi:LPS export ABC transporter permease LptF [Histidinibacterium aquaticum]|uniref:LPS export ABC transporter permease LptF n=1 Tax=Histidinibacterium aquaticum TaxID=2613962 RepID=A0A5J5GNS5_9RHOB|nr:LPS export ABC transporter permease LptF [Histidinibacterium aquaticum]KAA9009373.1 LPS export ABC transporter permease LptF [Histidinibacterium aquaticum]